MKKITFIQLAYPYGKNQTYLGGSLLSVASKIQTLGNFDVNVFDLNLVSFEEIYSALLQSDYIGITVTGAPYIPPAIKLTKKLQYLHVPILIGGQGIAKISNQDFDIIFSDTHAVQIKNDLDILEALGFPAVNLQKDEDVSFLRILRKLSQQTIEEYLRHEMTLVLSQGCGFKCAFCAAEKNQPEKYRSIVSLEEELRWLCVKAKEFGIKEVFFYASNLDFFQRPTELVQRLLLIEKISQESGIKIKIRCLSCMSSFINACKKIPDLQAILRNAGIYSIGFGVDGLDDLIWKAQKKNQNHDLDQVWWCINKTKEWGIRIELLMIMGFKEEGIRLLFANLSFACIAVFRNKNVLLRPYLAKEEVPGNDYWNEGKTRTLCVKDPNLFYNLDYCAFGSKVTHLFFFHRLLSNLVYFIICFGFKPFGKCATSPLMPLGKTATWNYFARTWNRLMPMDL